MARRVFVSYKYADDKVASLTGDEQSELNMSGTARDYVDVIMQTIEGAEIYNGEEGDNDLSEFTDEQIKTQLKYLIRHSSITIVLISKGMKDALKTENEQWIPWEIQYSLTRRAYGKIRTNRNGMLAVILPDENGSYDYYLQQNDCLHCNTVTHKTQDLFEMLGKNMFNLDEPNTTSCPSPLHSSSIHLGEDHSYIYQVKWDNFINDPSAYIDVAEGLKKKVESYKLKKRVTSYTSRSSRSASSWRVWARRSLVSSSAVGSSGSSAGASAGFLLPWVHF